nr:hypothetical protein [Planococcus glaciei]
MVLINNQWVFRFPKTEQVAEYVKIETHLLHDFRKQTSLNIKVPQPTLLYGSKQQLMCSCYDLPVFLLSILQESTGITGQRSPEWRLNITTVQRIEKSLWQRIEKFYGLQPVFHELLRAVKEHETVQWDHALDRFKKLKSVKLT